MDEIYQIEEKINLLNAQLNKDTNQNNFMKKIEELKSLRNNLLQKKIKLNEIFCSEMQRISNEIKEKFSMIKNIENNIILMKNELLNYNTLNFQNLKLRKYILANSAGLGIVPNFFLTEEEINDIILDNIDISQNNEIVKLKRDIEINKASEKVIINNYNEVNLKIVQIQENLKMLKEEKNTTKNELINLISCKESLESIIKLNINQLNIHNNNQDKIKENDNNSEIEEYENNKWTKPSELYMYELEVIDSNKASKLICNQLFNIFNINNNKEDDNNSNDNDNIYKESKIIKKKISKNKSNVNIINSYTTIDDYNYINDKSVQNNNPNEIFNDYNTINNTERYTIQNSIVYPYSNNKNKRFELNKNLSNISSIFSKKIIASYIQTELDKYISGEINSYKTIYEFLENLSIIIISKFQYANIIISSETLTIYLSYAFKSIYYETIINSKIKFVNKDYKNTKKHYKKLIPMLYSELSKLETKYQEYKSKTEVINKQIKLLEKSSKNLDIKKIKKIKLNNDEQNYIQICSKANGLNKQKINIENTIAEYENKKVEIKKENDDMLIRINEEINIIDGEIVQINKEMKIEQNALNNNINNYKEIIKEKYKIINEQLQIYKDKYGSNLDIYNKLINSINNTIKKSHLKSPLIIINNNNINNSNIFSYDQQIFNDDINLSNLNKNNENELSSITNSKNINIPRKVKKVKSKINFIKPKFETLHKSKKINSSNTSNLSINTEDLKDRINKNFYSMNLTKSKSKILNKNKKNEKEYNINSIYDNRASYTNDRRYEKYNKFYQNYYHQEDSRKTLNLNLDIHNNSNTRSYKSYSFIRSKTSRMKQNKENNFNKNITKKKLRLPSYKKDKAIYTKINLSNNISHSHYNSTFLNKSDLNKLNMTLQGLKDVITQRDSIQNKLIEKIKPLTNTIFCYFRNYYNLNTKTNKLYKYNPLLNISPEILCEYPYKFIPGKLFLELNKNININISPINNIKINKEAENEVNLINILDIENTIVNSKLKLIIEVLRDFRKYKESSKFKSFEDFVKNEFNKKKGLTKEEIEKCAKNKNFNFSIAIKGGIVIEIIICSYEEFKMWINGLAFLIKNKNELSNNIE